MIRIIIVSDIRFYREGLAEVLDSKDAIKIVGTAYDVKNAVIKIFENTPDIVLVDMAMIASCEAVNRIISSCPNTRIVALAMTEDEDTILACAKAGIAGYVSREASLDQLINTVYGVKQGEMYCPRRIAASLFKKIKSLQKNEETLGIVNVASIIENHSEDPQMILLTQREKQITALLSDGLSNKQIARNLTIEVSTVKNHVHNILTKMGLTSRVQIVALMQQ